jgi:hypothetical protein
MPRYLLALLGAAALLVRSAPACTMAPLQYTRSVRVVLFLGAARTDTILVGSGGVSVTRAAGHFGAGPAREVYGQVVGVERVGEAWRSLIPRGTREVVLVPWDYAADCSPVFWSRSARWLPSSASGLFSGELRERQHWVGGRPTLDVFAPEFEPYPSAAGLLRFLRIGAGSGAPLPEMLSPAVALEMYSSLPTDSMLWFQPDSAMAAIRRWALAHPRLAALWPASQVLGMLGNRVESLSFRRRTSPLAGTYRFTVAFASGDTVVLYGRSEANLLGEIHSLGWVDPQLPRSGPDAGYYLLTHFRRRLDELPTEHDGRFPNGYLGVIVAPLLETPDSTVYRGDADLLRVIQVIDSRQPVGAFLADLFRVPRRSPGDAARPGLRSFPPSWFAPVDLLRDSATYFAPGLFTVFPDGRVRFAWLGRRGDTTIVAILGERISTQTLIGPFTR